MGTRRLKQWRISNTKTGVDFGVYEASSKPGALDAFARDAGYKNYREALKAAPVPPGEIKVVEVEE